MCHNSNPPSPQHQMVNRKTHHSQRCYAKFLRLSTSHRMPPIPPLVGNVCQTCFDADANEVLTDLQRCFFRDHKVDTPYNIVIDGRVYAMKTFTKLVNQQVCPIYLCKILGPVAPLL